MRFSENSTVENRQNANEQTLARAQTRGQQLIQRRWSRSKCSSNGWYQLAIQVEAQSSQIKLRKRESRDISKSFRSLIRFQWTTNSSKSSKVLVEWMARSNIRPSGNLPDCARVLLPHLVLQSGSLHLSPRSLTQNYVRAKRNKYLLPQYLFSRSVALIISLYSKARMPKSRSKL